MTFLTDNLPFSVPPERILSLVGPVSSNALPVDNSDLVVFTGTGVSTITGITSPATARKLVIVNAKSSGVVVLAHRDSAGPGAVNLQLGYATSATIAEGIFLTPGQSIELLGTAQPSWTSLADQTDRIKLQGLANMSRLCPYAINQAARTTGIPVIGQSVLAPFVLDANVSISSVVDEITTASGPHDLEVYPLFQSPTGYTLGDAVISELNFSAAVGVNTRTLSSTVYLAAGSYVLAATQGGVTAGAYRAVSNASIPWVIMGTGTGTPPTSWRLTGTTQGVGNTLAGSVLTNANTNTVAPPLVNFGRT